MKVNSIYAGIEGEGVFVGTPTIFIRFQGCKVGCKNCDTPEALDHKKGDEIAAWSIMRRLRKWPNIKRVSLTGGNPLEQSTEELYELKKELKKNHYLINWELPGVNDYVTSLEQSKTENRICLNWLVEGCQVSLDVKTPSTGLWEKSFKSFEKDYLAYSILVPAVGVQIKMVVETIDDLEAVKEFADRLYDYITKGSRRYWPLVLTPSWRVKDDKIDPEWYQKIFDFLGSNSIFNKIDCRLIVQQHKMIYGSKKRDV
jgi:7-carboxy-7-deazaguanine synthase